MVGLGGIGRGQALAALVKAREAPAPGGSQMSEVAAKQMGMIGDLTVPGTEINNNNPAGGFGGGHEFGGDSGNKLQNRQTSCRRCGQEGHFARECPNSQQQEGNFGGGFNAGAKQSEGDFGGGFDAQQQNGGGFGGGFGAQQQGGGGFGGGFGAQQQGGSGGNACRICNEDGHFARDCSKKTAGGGACRVCNEDGHFARECPNKPADSNTCRYCKEEGHMVRDCQNKPAGSNACRVCNEEGHFARECPNKPAQKCHNCDKEGHLLRECPEPRRGREDSAFPPPADYVPEEVDEEKLFEQLPIRTGVHFSQIFDIAVQRTGKTEAQYPALETFASIALPDVVRENVQKAGYEVPTPVQRHCIPLIAAGLDLMGFAQTGSGKTAAFLLPIIHSLVAKGDTGKLDDKLAPSAIILAPTRELARQIHSDARMLAHGTDIPIAILYGGTKVAHQQMLLMRGCTILVATPGRLLHFIDRSHLVLDKCRFLVLDEADRMLDEGFGPEVRKLVEMTAMPDKQSRQTLMFSATFEESVQQLAREMLKPEFVFVAVGIVGGACLDITQSFLRVPQTEKKDKLMELLRLDIDRYEKREEEPYTKKTLVFVERKRTADVVASFLSQENLPAISIHGDRGQQLREEALRMFTSGECPVLVATAVAARGLDIKGVDHVINYDLPQTQEDYVHRIGRTGRIGNLGRATSFFDSETDHALADKLVQVLSDAQQVVPEWLANQAGVGGVSGYGDRTDFGSDAQKTNDAWGTDDQKPSTAAVNGDPQW